MLWVVGGCVFVLWSLQNTATDTIRLLIIEIAFDILILVVKAPIVG